MREAIAWMAAALVLGIALAALLVMLIAPAHAAEPPYRVYPVHDGCLYIAGNANSTAMVYVLQWDGVCK